MKKSIAKGDHFERHSFFIKLIRIFSVPILNNSPRFFLKLFMKNSSRDAEIVMNNVGSARALEVMYGRYRKNIFSRGLLQGVANFFWHHCVSQSKGVRNRLKIVEMSLEEEINKIFNKKVKKQINILTIGGGSARGIVEVLDRNSYRLNEWDLSVINIDKSTKSIDLGMELAKEFNLYGRFQWINDLAQNTKYLIRNDSIDIVEMVGLLDYFSDQKSIEVFRQIYDVLVNDGLFIVGNIIPNTEQSFISRMGWPKMYYRSAFDLNRLLKLAGFSDEKGEIITEPLKNHIVGIVRK